VLLAALPGMLFRPWVGRLACFPEANWAVSLSLRVSGRGGRGPPNIGVRGSLGFVSWDEGWMDRVSTDRVRGRHLSRLRTGLVFAMNRAEE
jgi:hypothetical protein